MFRRCFFCDSLDHIWWHGLLDAWFHGQAGVIRVCCVPVFYRLRSQLGNFWVAELHNQGSLETLIPAQQAKAEIRIAADNLIPCCVLKWEEA